MYSLEVFKTETQPVSVSVIAKVYIPEDVNVAIDWLVAPAIPEPVFEVQV